MSSGRTTRAKKCGTMTSLGGPSGPPGKPTGIMSRMKKK